MRLSYRSRRNGGAWRAVDDSIALVSTPCKLGGERLWFCCPGCFGRAAKLYSASAYFRCRRCCRLPQSVQQNLLDVSKVSEEAARKNPHRLVPPAHSNLSGSRLIDVYLGNTPFASLFMTPVPFLIPRRAFQAHGICLVPSEHGKTQTAQNIILSFLKEDEPPPLVILDNMGAMLKKIERLAVFDGRLKNRLLVLDPRERPPLNLFKLSGGSPAQQMYLFEYIFRAIDHTLTPRQATTVAFLVQLMQKVGGTLDTLRQVCEEKQPSHSTAIDALDPLARDFFWNQFYSRDQFINQTKAQIAARLYTLSRNRAFFEMFAAPHNGFNAGHCIRDKLITLISTDRAYLGDEGSAIFGRFILAQCLAAAFARADIPERERHLALLIVDEFKTYADEEVTPKIFTNARQFGLGISRSPSTKPHYPRGSGARSTATPPLNSSALSNMLIASHSRVK